MSETARRDVAAAPRRSRCGPHEKDSGVEWLGENVEGLEYPDEVNIEVLPESTDPVLRSGTPRSAVAMRHAASTTTSGATGGRTSC